MRPTLFMWARPSCRWQGRVRRAWVGGLVASCLAAAGAGCSGAREADFRAGGVLFDGDSLKGWRLIDGSWAIREGAICGVGPKARIVREGRYPPSYRLRFEVAPHGCPEVSWAVTVPVGGVFVLNKGLFLFSGGPDDWRDAWQAVEVVVRAREVSYRFPGLRERLSQQHGTGRARFRSLERARELHQKGWRLYDRSDGQVVLSPPHEVWRATSAAFREGVERGQKCLEGRCRGLAFVVPCTGRDGRELGPSAAARFRNVVVEPLP